MVTTKIVGTTRLAGNLPRWVYGKLPASAKKAVKKFIGGAAAGSTPVLSIIIPVYNVEAYVAETLDSLQRQSLVRWEAIVVNDGSTDGSAAIVERYARTDRRIQVIHQQNAGLGAARNVGIRAARGKFLTFLDSDDIIPDDAYKIMVDSLKKSHSDFAVGAVHRISNGKNIVPVWTKEVHASTQLGISIDDYPNAMMDVLACNRVFLTEFWKTKIGYFPVGVAYEDHRVMVAAYVRSAKFDLLRDVTYLWRIREDQGSISQQKQDLDNLNDSISAKNDAFEVLTQEASSNVLQAWHGRLLDQGIPLYAEHALKGDEYYRSTVQEFAHKYVSMASSETWKEARWNQRIRTSLMARGMWNELAELQEYFRQAGGIPATRISGQEVELVTDSIPFSETLLPDGANLLADRFTILRGYVERASWGEESWSISGFAFVSHVDPEAHEWRRRFYIRNLRTKEDVDLEAADSEYNYFATRFARHGNFDYSSTGFKLRIKHELFESLALLQTASQKDKWQLRVELSTGDFIRDAAVEFGQKSGSAGWLRAAVMPSSSLKVIPIMDPDSGLIFEFRRDPILLETMSVNDGGLNGAISTAGDYSKIPESVFLQRGTVVLSEVPLVLDEIDGKYRFDALIAERISGGGNSRLRLRNTDGSSRVISWPKAESSPVVASNGTLMRSTHGYVDYFPSVCVPFVTQVSIVECKIRLTVTAPGSTLNELYSSVLRHANHSVRVSTVDVIDASHVLLEFDLLPSRGVTVGPNGSYRLVVSGQVARPSESLGDLLPISTVDDSYRYEIKHTGASIRRELLVSIAAPLVDEELGVYSQLRMRRAYQKGGPEQIQGVLFQCYRGETASDNQLAIHQELVRRGTSLKLYWGVSNSNVAIPTGGIPVYIGSQEWYRILGEVTCLCNNIDFDRFFTKRPHQRFLETFHGHPFKAMGIGFWKDKGFNQWEVEAEVERRNTAWDSIVLPNRESVLYYQEQYGFDGEYLVTGYPRNDAIVNGDALYAKSKLNDVYGIESGKTLVLYAPTWRDSSATGAWSAKMFDGLDVSTVADSLGDEYVLLIRGHNYNLREQNRMKRSASMIDVTDYPEINDLILAADISLLDYSSLRFDWAITKKPMLFFVPDKEEYLSARPGLFPYEESAPGPQLYSTDEVIDALREASNYIDAYGAELETFNARFNALSDGKASSRVVEEFFSHN